MRISYLAESSIPSRDANSVHVMKMCQAFARQGHDVTLYARYGSERAADCHRYYGVRQTFEIVRCARPRWRRAGRAVAGWRLARALAARQGAEVLYGRDAFALMASARLGRPMVLEAHGVPRGAVLRTVQGWLFGRSEFRRLVVISDALRQDYRRAFPRLPAARIVVAHDGADLPPAVPASPAQNGRFHVGYLGHLYAGKGLEVILPAARQLPGVEFHIAGGTETDLARWRRAAASLENLTLHGHLPPAETEAFRQGMDVLLVPTQSRVGRAGGGTNHANWLSPLKLFEAMASGKAVVASDLPVLREILAPEVNGLLVPPDDANAWVQAIERLRADRALRERLARRARADVAAQYTWDHRARRVLDGVAP